ncbi:MAG: HAD-IC family P-type ATPase [Candidatus Paceibacterota bacterium]|jgi:Ca2+-transporting ATPase
MEEKIKIQTPWFFTAEEVLTGLDTSINGLKQEEAEKRLKIFGLNKFKNKKIISIVDLALKQIISPLIFILVGAAILTGFLHEWINTIIIMSTVLINVGLGLYREYQAENTLDKLVTYIKDRSRVVRDGKEQEIDSSLLVPGDIIKLSYGSRVPADARVISSNNFKVDESILTGESEFVTKTSETIKESSLVADRTNMVYAGTLVVEGFDAAVVVETGINTELGKIADLVSNTDRAVTPIQKGVGQLSWYIFTLVIFVVMCIFILGVSRGEPILQMLILSAAIGVGAVPESLPIALTIILSVGAVRIASKKGIIRKLAAAETLGSTTLIMTDKTGTLTKADMQLVGVYTFDVLKKEIYSESNITNLSHAQKEIIKLSLKNIDVLVQNPDDIEKKWNFTGHPFEVNIAKASTCHNIHLRKTLIEENNLCLPFNSTNKFSLSRDGDNYIIMGAPDILLKMSDVDKDTYIKILSWIEDASKNGKRLIALGTFKTKNIEDIKKNLIKNVSFEGILSFFDPIREEVPFAVKNIESHGVKIVIITGDLKGTAISVARSIGWNITDEDVLTGEDIHLMTDSQLKDVIKNIKIFARVTPEDKLRIGNLYRDLGEIVAMTGDGVNDAPALKSMDIGISLSSGSDVAQSASDLVLLDDNFQTISMAIDEGRRILANIRKTFIYLMSNAFDSIFIIGGSFIMNMALPITALQIIWVNLFTGSLPALAFAYDDNLDKGINKESFKKQLLTTEVKMLSFGLGTISSILIFLLYYVLLQFNIDIKIVRSIFFVCFSIYILVIAFSFRSLYKPIFSYNPFSNKKLNVAIIIGVGILVATMSIPFIRNLFDIAPMPLSWMWLVVCWCILNVLLVEFTKWLFMYRIKVLNKK